MGTSSANSAPNAGDVGANSAADHAAPAPTADDAALVPWRLPASRALRLRAAPVRRGKGGGEAEGLGGRGRTPKKAPAAARQRKPSSAVSPRPRVAFKTFVRNLRARVAKGPLLRVMTWLMLMVQYGSMKYEAWQ